MSHVRTSLLSYHYQSSSASMLYPFLERHWYRRVLHLIPTWVHPNAITMVSSCCAIAAFLLCLAVAGGHVGAGLLAVAGWLFWSYHTLDNVDGPQARRTGTSSPIGELFDHSADAFAIFMVPLGVMPCLGVSPELTLVVVALAGIAGWAAMWELHHTNMLVSGRLSDIEACLVSCGLVVFAGIAGNDVANAPLFGIGPSLVDAVVVLAICGFSWQTLACLFRQRRRLLRLQLLPVLAVQGALLVCHLIAPEAFPVLPVGVLMGVVAARSNILAITTRLFGQPYRAIEADLIAVAVALPVLVIVDPTSQSLVTLLVWMAAAAVAARNVTIVVQHVRTACRVLDIGVFRTGGAPPAALEHELSEW